MPRGEPLAQELVDGGALRLYISQFWGIFAFYNVACSPFRVDGSGDVGISGGVACVAAPRWLNPRL